MTEEEEREALEHTTIGQARLLSEAWHDLVMVMADELRIPQLLDWMASRRGKVNK